ncbi:FAD-dependent oxidoreductase [Gammaproteobacteria bacterium LSUCC0112]|nr:FAD-dependent oxidoreductase [Gammaproteobacteria bacterium LSUCC0112]
MRIAIIGSGISGLVAAYKLHARHDITVFEAADRLGGHTATIDVKLDNRHYAIDTGFIVYNDWTYPNFIKLMDELGVQWRESDMSFGVNCELTGLQYAGVTGQLAMINSLFAQRRNLLSPSFLRLLLDILAFNKQAILDVETDNIPDMTLKQYVEHHKLGNKFMDYYLVPMCSAIWSTPFLQMYEFPTRFLLPFLYKHGLINVHNRPRWRTLTGGSKAYLAPMSAGFANNIRLESPVFAVKRDALGVDVHSNHGWERFDQVIIACHSDQALALLSDSSAAEHQVLSAIAYQANDVVLHTDVSVMPENRRAWASWNYHLNDDRSGLPRLTYDMNRLMGITGPDHFFVSLNHTDHIDPAKIHGRFDYAHPIFTSAGADAQTRWSDVNGVNRTWFCGAWWGKGFHEDGVVSALRVVDGIQYSANGTTQIYVRLPA